MQHFPNVTTAEYFDGQDYLDILKVAPLSHHLRLMLMVMPKVYPSMSCATATEELSTYTLHPRILTISNDDWAPLQ